MKTNNFIISNVDTDALSFCKADMSPMTKEEQMELLKELNSLYPEKIKFAHDGYFQSFVVVKAKNYIMKDERGKLKIKGSSMKSVKTEKILKQMINELVVALADHKLDEINDIYTRYVKEAKNVKDITKWGKKVTITKAILNCKGYTEQDIVDKKIRRNETEIWEAVKNKHIQEGDRVEVYPAILGTKITSKPINKKGEVVGYKEVEEIVYGLKLIEDYNDDADVEQLIKRVYDTLKIFKTVINMDNYINYNLVKNKKLLDNL